MDMGLPGPDAGKGGKHLILPSEYKGEIPQGFHSVTATTNRVLLMLRAIPLGGNDAAAVELLKTVNVHPLNPPADWTPVQWIEQGNKPGDFTPIRGSAGSTTGKSCTNSSTPSRRSKRIA
jgi:hypothetical protein